MVGEGEVAYQGLVEFGGLFMMLSLGDTLLCRACSLCLLVAEGGAGLYRGLLWCHSGDAGLGTAELGPHCPLG